MNLWISSTFSSDRQPTISWRVLCGRAVIGLVLFVLANLLTYWASGYFDQLRHYQHGVEAAIKHPNLRVLFVGDSHIDVPLNGCLNGSHAGTAYSIAAGGDSLRECFAKVRYILERSPTVDTLIVSADPHMFGSGRLESSNRSFADQYFLTAVDSTGLKKGWLSALLDQVPLFNDDFVQYLRKAIAKRMTTPSSTVQSGPAEAAPVLWENLSDSERTAKAVETGVMDHKGVGEYEEPFFWYRRLLDLAHAYKVRVVGVRFPVHSAYAAEISPERVTAIDDVLRRHGIAEILDFRNLFTNPTHFRDADHVKGQYGEALVCAIEKRLGVQLKVPRSGRHTKQ